MTKHKPTIELFMPRAGEDGVIFAWVSGNPDVMDFRGPALSGTKEGDKSALRQMFDSLNTMHQNELRQSRQVRVLGNQRDHGAITKLMDSAVGSAPVGYGHARIRLRTAPAKPRPTNEAPREVKTVHLGQRQKQETKVRAAPQPRARRPVVTMSLRDAGRHESRASA